MDDIPPNTSIHHSRCSRQVLVICRVARGITLHCDPLSGTHISVGDRNVQLVSLDLGRSFDEGGCETSLYVPLDVAMEEIDARIVGYEADRD